jgi:16S rRNA processing protein RimM
MSEITVNKSLAIHSIIGKTGAAYGILGWIRVSSFTENQLDIFSYSPWLLQNRKEKYLAGIEKWQSHGNRLVVKLEGVNDRNKAILFTNYDIIMKSDRLPQLDHGEYYWKDIIGCQVVSYTYGYNMGSVTGFMETGSNDVMVVKANPEDGLSIRERLIPFIDTVIKKVDLHKGILDVDWDPNF